LHWAWFLIAYFSIRYRTHVYSSPIFSVLEYVSLFLIVLIHEFGHQLACRQVGGQTHDIVLWPFGGVAYVSPPQRPGAQLWSIAAGPLVNLALIPVLSVLVAVSSHLGWFDTLPDAYSLIHNIWYLNVGLLIFNLFPIYPLDGGQILRSLLWFPLGRANSLLATTIIGFIGVVGLIGLSVLLFFNPDTANSGIWLGAISVYILLNCWGGLTHARALVKVANAPRREGYSCPNCKAAPPQGEFWLCGKCGKTLDAFLTRFACPYCGTEFRATLCVDCGISSPTDKWVIAPSSNEVA
jgi:Zn-dependent protease